MLAVNSLQKRYRGQQAVEEVSFAVRGGEIVGLLGPNGAGKSTTVGMICGLVVPGGGSVLIDGLPIQGDADPRKAKIGLVPQELALYEPLSAIDNLRVFGSLYGLRGAQREVRVAAALAIAGLSERANDKVSNFSGGMKRRLNIACALVHEPDIIILDEPTVGVDPQSRNAIFEVLEALRDAGKALLYTTHYMEEAERLCDRVVIMDHGKVVAEGPISLLIAQQASSRSLEEVFLSLTGSQLRD